MLGACYADGKGVPRDLDAAAAHLRQAAAMGHKGAAEALETQFRSSQCTTFVNWGAGLRTKRKFSVSRSETQHPPVSVMDSSSAFTSFSYCPAVAASSAFSVGIHAPSLGLAYQRPSTATLNTTLVHRGGAGAMTVLFRVDVEVADAFDERFSPMARAEYTFLVGTSEEELGPEVSHVGAWHVLPPDTTTFVKVSPLEYPANTGRYMRLRVGVRSLGSPDAGDFFTEPRVIMSRATSMNAILKSLNGPLAVEARAVGQRWEGALVRPERVPQLSVAGLAKKLFVLTTRAKTRKGGKGKKRGESGGAGRRAAVASSDSDGGRVAEADGDVDSDDDASAPAAVPPPAHPQRGLAGSTGKRSAASARLAPSSGAAPQQSRLRGGGSRETSRAAATEATPLAMLRDAISAHWHSESLLEAEFDEMMPSDELRRIAGLSAESDASLSFSSMLGVDEHVTEAAVAVAAGGTFPSLAAGPSATKISPLPPLPTTGGGDLPIRSLTAQIFGPSPARGPSVPLCVVGVSPNRLEHHWVASYMSIEQQQSQPVAWPRTLSASSVGSSERPL